MATLEPPIVPPDFDWTIYLHPQFNPDLVKCGLTSESSAIDHWLTHGHKENRHYKAHDPADRMTLLPIGFTWTGYLAANPQLVKQGITTKRQAIQHWLGTGQWNGSSFKPPQPTQALITFGHQGGGGLARHIRDLLNEVLLNPRLTDGNWEILTDQLAYNGHPLIDVYHPAYLLSILQSKELLIYQQVIVHIHCFSGNYHLYSVADYQLIVDRIRRVRSKVIITVHDYTWLWPHNYAPTVASFPGLTVDSSRMADLNRLFDSCDNVIFPTKTCLTNYQSKGLRTNQAVVNPHPDYVVAIAPYVPTIKPGLPIKILHLGNLDWVKGYSLIMDVLATGCVTQKIEFHILGGGDRKQIELPFNITVIYHGPYQEAKVFESINAIQPDLCLLNSLFYETWGYTATIILNSGLPIFYHESVYAERIGDRPNAYSYSTEMSLREVAKLLREVIEALKIDGTGPFQPLPEQGLVFDQFYQNLYC